MITQHEENVKQNTQIKKCHEDSQSMAEQLYIFQQRKAYAMEFQRLLSNILDGEQKERVLSCGNWLAFRQWFNEAKTTKLHEANFCKNKFCPFCAWRWHVKYSKLLGIVFEKYQQKQFYHIVLTLPNTKYLTKEFLLEKRKQVFQFIKKSLGVEDYLVSFELTISEKGEYHPHFHIIAICKEDKIPTRKFVQMEWAKVSKSKSAYNICKVIKCTDERVSQELTKYILKFDNNSLSQEHLEVAYIATKGLRKISCGGIILKGMREAKEILKNLVETEYEYLSNFDSEVYFFEWFNQGYELRKTKTIEGKAFSLLKGQGSAGEQPE